MCLILFIYKNNLESTDDSHMIKIYHRFFILKLNNSGAIYHWIGQLHIFTLVKYNFVNKL